MDAAIHPPLVGRERELGLLDHLLDGVAAGPGGAGFVIGEAGIGKTRLVDETLALARGKGFVVFRGAAEELERNRPFAAVREAWALERASEDPARRRLARLILGDFAGSSDSDLLAGEGPALCFLIVDGVVELVEAAASVAPVVIALEDLHWADPSTLLTVSTLVRRLTQLPVAVLATFRPGPSRPELRQITGALVERGALQVALSCLDAGAVDALVAHVLGSPPRPSLRSEVNRAGGNPLFVIELVRALHDEAGLRRDPEGVDLVRATVGPSLRQTLLRRLASLHPCTFEALRIGAVLGASFVPAQLSLVMDRGPLELLPSLEDAVHAGVLGETGERLAFRHDLIRRAIYEDIPPALRKCLHLHAGRALAASGASAAQVAEHLALGASRGDAAAVRWIREAAREAAQRAPAAAVELLERALELVAEDDADADMVVAELVSARLWSGRLVPAEELARATLARSRHSTATGALELALTLCLLASGRTAEMCREVDGAVRRPELSDSTRAQLLANAAFGHLYNGDPGHAAAIADEARAIAAVAHDAFAVAAAIAARSQVELYRGSPATAIELLDQALAGVEAAQSVAADRFHFHVFRGVALMDADRFDDAAAAIVAGRALSERVGAGWNLPLYQWTAFLLGFSRGDWDNALAEATAGFALADEVGTRIGSVCVSSAIALIALHRNDLRRCADELARADAERAASGPQPYEHWRHWVAGLLHDATGESALALDSIERAWDACSDAGQVSDYLTLGPDFVRLLLGAGHRPRAKDVTADVEAVAGSTGTASAATVARWCRGQVDGDVEALRDAVSVSESSPRPLLRARVCEDAATTMGHGRTRPEIVGLLEAACSSYELLGARRDIARVEGILRTHGVRRGRGRSRDRPRLGWESLTATERGVVDLILEGLTNRQVAEHLYVSPRTVDAHVSHIFTKLGCASRMELARLAAARSLT